MKKAVVAGHICIDITPVFPEGIKRVSSVGDLLLPGKLINMEKPDIHTGGAVANTGLGMKVLGADVKLLGKIGDDEFGRMVMNILNRYGAGTDLIVDSDSVTSYSVVVAVPGIDRIFLHCPGANDTFTSDDIPDSALEEAALFHFGYPTIMRKMYLEDGKYLKELFSRMSGKGISTSLDLAAVDPNAESGRAEWEKILSAVLPYVDFFVPSFEELCFMLDREKYEELQKRAEGGDITLALDMEEDIVPLADRCLKMGAKAVLLKCGAPGMFLKTSHHMSEAGARLLNTYDQEKTFCPADWNDFAAFEKSYKIEKVLSGTGAGDTSIAAFLTSVLEGYGPKQSLEHAAAAGALCCTSYDAVSGLKSLREIRTMIDSGWEKA